MTFIRRLMVQMALCVLWVGVAGAQPPAASAPSTLPAQNLLGPGFRSLAAGIELAPPAGSREIRGALGSDEIVRFVHDERRWVVRVTRVILEKSLALTTWKDADGVERPGMLESITEQFKRDNPSHEILRSDTTNIADADVGILVARYNFALETNLLQQAIVRGGELVYFVISMTSPAPRTGDLEEDPNVVLAAETFQQMLSSIRLLDQTELKLDQEDRLFRTRTLYVNLTERKLREALIPEQWFRVIREGKDIGYSYVVEEVARDLPRKGKIERSPAGGPHGILVGVRSRMIPQPGVQIDSETWMFNTFDRKVESWATLTYATDAQGGKTTGGELGVARWREKPVPDPGQDIGSKRGVSLTEEYRLEVTKLDRNASSEPIVRDLPPFYLPQALGHLLPRVLPRRDPKTYLFATWVPQASQLMYRYIDVLPERDVNLLGRRVRAVTVLDRIGLEGPTTNHYFSPEGKYLGSFEEQTKTVTVPTDAATLVQIWKNANLTRPGDVEEK
ncbi:hypothetical protein [Fontivita pretiosa]|uniref:hypothetical protein n=1 Tax=Fontivita pretiosa TaxID=2989684 RepID=UPI003D18397A